MKKLDFVISPLNLSPIALLDSNVHEGQKLFCESCDLSFSEPVSLKNHMTLHKDSGINVEADQTTTQIKKRKLDDDEDKSVQEKPKYLYSKSSQCVRDQNCV